jgi:glycosyltransferase involved in cell wall biosynthesis
VSVDPIRVLCLIKGLGRGGAEMLLQAQIRERDRDEFDCEVVYLSAAKDALVSAIEAEDVTVTCLGARSSADLRWLPHLRRRLLAGGTAIVHAHSPVAAAGARLVVRSLPRTIRPKMITTDHNVWSSHTLPTRAADRLTAAFDDARIAVSAAVRASLPARLAIRTDVIRHGIDVPAVAVQRVDRTQVRRELDVDGMLVVGTVANLRATKGWPDLLVAARHVLDEVDNACFVAVGQGPMEHEIEALHRSLRLGDRFRLMGYRTDAVRLMAGCDLFCLASHHEGLPVAVMEAMALGLPIVATDVGGVGELVVDQIHGRLVPPHQSDALANALIELLTDEDRRAKAAEAVLAKATALSNEVAVRRIEAIYETLAHERDSGSVGRAPG